MIIRYLKLACTVVFIILSRERILRSESFNLEKSASLSCFSTPSLQGSYCILFCDHGVFIVYTVGLSLVTSSYAALSAKEGSAVAGRPVVRYLAPIVAATGMIKML